MQALLRIASLIFTVFLLACSDSPSLGYISEDRVILAFGDSLTVGVGAPTKDSYPSVLARLSDRHVINAGVSGEVTKEGLTRLPAVLDEHQPELVVLLHGGNDILRSRDIEQAKSNLSAMINMIESQGADVVLIGVPEKKLFSSVAPIYEELANEHGVVFIDDTLSGLLRNNEFKSDPIHLNAAGYSKLAEEIHQKLVEGGAL